MDESTCAICAKPTEGTTFCSEKCRDAALWVSCPWCFAKRDADCIGLTTHPSRLRAAKEYVQKLLSTPIQALIDRSSLGTPEAKCLRESADPEAVRRALELADKKA